MLTNEYFEKMKGHYSDYTLEEVMASRSYYTAKKYGLPYPIVIDTVGYAKGFAQVFINARVNKFVFANPSTYAVDFLAELLKAGYKITGVVSMTDYLGGENTWLTTCKNGLYMNIK
jgi:hypothetical protein